MWPAGGLVRLAWLAWRSLSTGNHHRGAHTACIAKPGGLKRRRGALSGCICRTTRDHRYRRILGGPVTLQIRVRSMQAAAAASSR